MNSLNKTISTVVAKESDGTIQITFTIPYVLIQNGREEALIEISKDIEVAGFRKGKAPIEKVKENVEPSTLIERALSKILPIALGEALTEHKIKPLIYPKFELVSAKENEDWQVRAITCEFPKFTLGDFRKEIASLSKTASIWTPGQTKDEPKEKSREEKEQQVIKLLISTTQLTIPKPLINEEVDARLSSLLERTERLGLSLEKYLLSIGKTPETLRQEYEAQAGEALKLDIILTKIADEQNLEVNKDDIDKAIQESSSDESTAKKLDTPEQRRFIEAILKKRAVLDSLTALI